MLGTVRGFPKKLVRPITIVFGLWANNGHIFWLLGGWGPATLSDGNSDDGEENQLDKTQNYFIRTEILNRFITLYIKQ